MVAFRLRMVHGSPERIEGRLQTGAHRASEHGRGRLRLARARSVRENGEILRDRALACAPCIRRRSARCRRARRRSKRGPRRRGSASASSSASVRWHAIPSRLKPRLESRRRGRRGARARSTSLGRRRREGARRCAASSGTRRRARARPSTPALFVARERGHRPARGRHPSAGRGRATR